MPNIDHIEPPDGYAQLLWHGFDWWEESHDVTLFPDVIAEFERAKVAAKKADPRGRTPCEVKIGCETFEVKAHGGRGVPYLVGNSDFRMNLRPPAMRYPVTVQLTSAGLAQHGMAVLRDRVRRWLSAHGRVGDDMRLSRVDYAFDVHSPAFAREMVPEITKRFVVTSRVKDAEHGSIIGAAGRVETLYLGSQKSRLLIVIYDKGKEIRQASGKTWLYDIWEAFTEGAWTRPAHGEPVLDVRRVEIRFKREFLKNRRVNLDTHFMSALNELLAEALYTRRLTVPEGTNNRQRWPLAPLWTLLVNVNPADAMRPIGRLMTKTKAEVASLIIDNVAGSIRTAAVLTERGGDADDRTGDLFDEARERLWGDRKHEEKKQRARRRYASGDKAR